MASPPTSIADLPSELLAEIVALALPEDVPSTHVANAGPKTGGSIPELVGLFFRGVLRGLMQPRHPYATLYVSRRFHAEAIRVLRARQFKVIINERFTRTKSAYRPGCILDRRASFPGLDLRSIQGLTIEIQPTNLPRFWRHIKSNAATLCTKRLLPRGRLRRLTIKINDMRESTLMTQAVSKRYRPRDCVVKSDDYLALLEHFVEVVVLAYQCEIHLPYWMQAAPAQDKLELREWEYAGARIVFSPPPDEMPEFARENAAMWHSFMRYKHHLVPLSRELTGVEQLLT